MSQWLMSCYVSQLSLRMDWGHLSASLLQYSVFVSNTTVLMCSINITHFPNRKEQHVHNVHLNIIFPINYDISNQNHACQYQKPDDMAAILPFWNCDDFFFLQYLHYSTEDLKLVLTKTYLSFKPTLFRLISTGGGGVNRRCIFQV